MMNRRQFLKLSVAAGASTALPFRVAGANGARLLGGVQSAFAVPAAAGLSDPAMQPKFSEPVPNALDPGFVFRSPNNKYTIAMEQQIQWTGLVGPNGETPVSTPVWGYGKNGPGGTWPGMTFVAQSGVPVEVKWENKLPRAHLLPVDTSLHWAYSLHGYTQYDIASVGVPAVAHLHGGHTDFQYDGNPEFFFSPGYRVRGPQWVDKKYIYDNSQPAGTLWYHDHALGITRLNVYAGLAGFYILRDADDTGLPGNDLDLPAYPYEVALAIQDRMFRNTGELFYPAFPGEPFYDDFITGEGAVLPPAIFPGGGPTALAEFFGDHMLVNGKIWPKMDVEPRNYRLRLLNGCDSRFLVAQFFEVLPDAEDFESPRARGPLDFSVVGSDQGLASSPTTVDTLVIETGSRYDIIFDFKTVTAGNRVIMKNIGGDAPFGGAFGDDLDPDDLFPDRQTDRIMAFDVVLPLDTAVPDVSPNTGYTTPIVPGTPTRTRKVALFEGKDEFGRLQPLLGTAEPAKDYQGNPINWPNEQPYIDAGLVGQMEGSIPWHSPTTENPKLGDTERWAIWNATGDAHPVHLHLVHFEIEGRLQIKWDSATTEDERVLDVDPETYKADGTYLVSQPVVQHNGALGSGFKLVNLTTVGGRLDPGDAYVENAPKDMVTALPGQVTFIRATFDKPGRYVWHCHILSHEDHEMMRVLHVGPGA
jgi:FtsP/CotA-like multicopper oxidase with cupredoxin domain